MIWNWPETNGTTENVADIANSFRSFMLCMIARSERRTGGLCSLGVGYGVRETSTTRALIPTSALVQHRLPLVLVHEQHGRGNASASEARFATATAAHVRLRLFGLPIGLIPRT